MTRLAGCTIAFDLDGTLVETAPDLLRGLNHVMRAEGLPLVTLEDIRRYIGRGAAQTIVRASAAHGITYSPDRLEQLTEAFVAEYARDIARESTLFPNLLQALDVLEAAGASFCVCTNKRTALSVQLLEALGVAHRFQAIVGADAVTRKKPDPAHFIQAIEQAGGSLSRSLMVGAGAPVIAVTFGYTETAPALLGADAVVSDFSELPDVASRLLVGRI
jgi:phosphoglycolate phosphatase